MHATQSEGETCGDCALWSRLNDQDGSCRACAPHPAGNPSEVAHWPRTHAHDYCGEWRAKNDAALVACGECGYWRHWNDGLHPQQREDQMSDWWRSAGHCLRFPARPSSEPGVRAFWRATHAHDACFEGKTRSP